MNLRLEELLIWFLELGQLYIVIYGIVGIIIVIIIGLSYLKGSKIIKSLMGIIPLIFIPVLGKMVLKSGDVPIPVNMDKLFFAFDSVWPVLIMIVIGITIWGGLNDI